MALLLFERLGSSAKREHETRSDRSDSERHTCAELVAADEAHARHEHAAQALNSKRSVGPFRASAELDREIANDLASNVGPLGGVACVC